MTDRNQTNPAGASLLNGLATTSNVLIGGRALQGLGAALVSPATKIDQRGHGAQPCWSV